MTHILVVDDEIGIRELLKEILEDSGYRVSTAASAAEADRRWSSERPDLVLLDLSLPDGDGLALIKSWSSRNKLPIPVIMLSGYASIDSAVEATRLGAQDFLEKPIALNRLLTAVSRALTTAVAEPKRPRPVHAEVSAENDGRPVSPDWPSEVFGLPYREACAEFERAYFLHVLASEGGNISRVATRVGIERTHLYRKFKSVGLRASRK